MENLQKRVSDYLKRTNIPESLVRLVLGIILIVLVGVLASNVFKNRGATPAGTTLPIGREEQNETATKPGELTTPAAAVALPTKHTVVAGENLWTISQKYYSSGYNWVDIAQANRLSNPNQIFAGEKLTIPNTPVRVAVQPSERPQVVPTITQNRIEGNTYTVIRGDNLWNIAVRAYGDGFAWTKIAQANHLANPDLIHAGNFFVIPR